MAHNLSTTNGRTAMFYAGEQPWHGLGTKVDGALTAAEAIKAAGLDWDVKEEPVYDGDGQRVEAYKLLRRADTRAILHVPKKGYRPIQNREAFSFFDKVTASGEAKYVTAGALGAGERIWIMAEIAKFDLRIGRTDDIVKPYLLLANAHDGTLACWMMSTSIRVVCQNTLTMAMSTRHSEGFRMQHRSGVMDRADEAREHLGFAVKYYEGLNEIMSGLAAKQVTSEALAGYYETLVPDNPEAAKTTRTEAIRGSMERLFSEGRGNDLPGVKGSWWAALNSVTEYVDHERTVRGKGDDLAAKRTASILFGSGATIKRKAYELAVELAGVGE